MSSYYTVGRTSTGDADPDNSDDDSDGMTHESTLEDVPPPCGSANENTTHSTSPPPPSEPDQVIDLTLLDTPDLDSSARTEVSPPVPRTPDAPPFQPNSSSPLSSASDTDESLEGTEGIRSLKRKRQTDRPKAKAAPRVRRKTARP